MSDQRFSRHSSLTNLDRLAEIKITMIGLGSLGSWGLINLIKMGCKHITVWDFDKVEIQNFANQIYSHHDAGHLKTNVMRGIIEDYLTEEEFQAVKFINDRYEGQKLKSEVAISATDNMAARKTLWEAAKTGHPQLFLDARMGGPLIQHFCIKAKDGEDIQWFEDPVAEWLFDDDAPDIEPRLCTEKGIIYGAQMGALHYANALSLYAANRINDYPRWAQYDLTWNEQPVFNIREGSAAWKSSESLSSIESFVPR